MVASHFDQLLTQTRSQQEWLHYFSTLDFREFVELHDHAVERFLVSPRKLESADCQVAVTVALARKLLIAAHFMNTLEGFERTKMISKAQTTFASVCDLSRPDMRDQLMTLWDGTLKYCRKYGFSDTGFGTPRLGRQFKDR